MQFRCPLCSEGLPTSLALEQHVNRDHADILSPMTNRAKGASSTTTGAKKRTRPDADDDDDVNNGNEEQVSESFAVEGNSNQSFNIIAGVPRLRKEGVRQLEQVGRARGTTFHESSKDVSSLLRLRNLYFEIHELN